MSSQPRVDPAATTLVRPFTGLLASPELASKIVAPPYDVVTSDEARELARGNQWSFLHVSKPEIDLLPGTDPYAAEVYDKAGGNMRRLIDEGAIFRDGAEHFYIYRIEVGEHVQTGLVAAGTIEAYRENLIRRHEVTRVVKEDDRVRQILAVNAHTGPVLTVHHADAAISAALAEITGRDEAASSVTAPDGSRHSLWVVDRADDIGALSAAYNALEALYIGDGHHRSAAADRVADEIQSSSESSLAPMLIVCFPENEIRIFGYHRVVRDLNGLGSSEFLSAVRELFTVTTSDAPVASPAPGHFGMYTDGKWYLLSPGAAFEQPRGAVESLDVSVLANRLLGPVLSIGDPRTDPRIDFFGGAEGINRLVGSVDCGDMAAGFSLCPLPISDLFAVADAGEIMPPKSTWFDPKLLDGLISCPLR